MSIIKRLSAAVLMACVLAGPAAAGKANSTLTAAFEQELPTVDWYNNSSAEVHILRQHVWDSLLYFDQQTHEVKPALAESYKQVDPTTLEFKLRSGVKWHDGSPFTADDVIYTFNYLIQQGSKLNKSDWAEFLGSVEKVGTDTVRVRLKHFTPSVDQRFGGGLPIYKAGTYDAGPNSLDKQPIGTGPYRIASIESGGTLILERFKDYYAGSPKGMPSIERIVWRTIPDLSTQAAELISGGIDFSYKIGFDQARDLGSVPDLRYENVSTNRMAFMIFDAAGRTKTPMTDVRVRQAIAHAIDRKTIARQLVGDAALALEAFCLPGHFGCTQEVTAYPFDPNKSKTLLRDAGFSNGFSISIGTWRDRPIAEAIVGNLRNVGIRADLQYIPLGTLVPLWNKGLVPIIIASFGSAIDDVAGMAPRYFDGDRDMTRDAEVTEWLRQGGRTADDAKRKDYYARALRKIAEHAYMEPLFSYTTSYVFRKDLDIPLSIYEWPEFYHAKWR